MMKTKFICVGDLHLEKLNSYFNNGDRFVYEQLDKVLNYARKEGVKRIIQLGDIFDGNKPEQETVKSFIEYLHKNDDLEWTFLTGNHDYFTNKADSTTLCAFLSNNKIIKNVSIYNKPTHRQIDGLDFFFAPFPHYEKFDYLQDKPCLCFGHFEIGGTLMDNGMPVKNGIPKNKLDEKDFWIIGHLHRKQELGRVYYPGTAYQLSFGEPLPKGFSVVEASLDTDSNKLEVAYDFIKLDTPYILENVYIKQQEDFIPLKINDPKYLYKIHIQAEDVTIPEQFMNGVVKNVYKIVNNYSNTSKEEFNNKSLGEEFIENNKDNFFEPLFGLEEYLEKQDFSEDEVGKVATILESLKQNYR